MNIYSQRQRWKLFLLIGAVLICLTSLWYTNKLVKALSAEEKKKVELWAAGTKRLALMQDDIGDLGFALDVITSNTTVPVILTNDKEEIKGSRNLDSIKAKDPMYLQAQLAIMKAQHERVEIPYAKDQKDYIYYKDSILLTQLRYYPYFQLGVIALFLLVAYLAFSSSRRAEQNQVWIGMAKETAHQLGTPLSSLIAWVELLKMKGVGKEMTVEVEKDITRLQTITDRFSKIGSAPALVKQNLQLVLENSTQYIQSRTSDKVHFSVVMNTKDEVWVPLNISLFEWVIENTCKNAVDAMDGDGSITLHVTDQQQYVYIDIVDTGKGISKSMQKTIFKPGFTTKSRGWGLGLSLSKRIIEDYHQGEIFVKNSELNKGTTIRIVLKK